LFGNFSSWRGGGSGGYVIVKIQPATTLTVTIGDGVSGAAGNATTVTGSNVSITANGGQLAQNGCVASADNQSVMSLGGPAGSVSVSGAWVTNVLPNILSNFANGGGTTSMSRASSVGLIAGVLGTGGGNPLCPVVGSTGAAGNSNFDTTPVGIGCGASGGWRGTSFSNITARQGLRGGVIIREY
jgi:hypothetical protein